MTRAVNKSKFRRKKTAELIFIICVLAYPLISFSVFYIGLNAGAFVYAFQRYDEAAKLHFTGFENFKSAWSLIFGDTSSLLYRGILNSLLIFTLTLVIGMPLNMLFGLYLYKKKFGHKTIRFTVLLPGMVSGIVVSLIFLKFVEGPFPDILTTLHLTKEPIMFLRDSHYNMGTIIFFSLWTGFGGALIYYPNAMGNVPAEMIESAKLDGASDLQQLWYILIPSIYPTITTFMVTGVAGILGTGGPLFAWYQYDAPNEVYFSGYYIFRQTMTGSQSAFPILAAVGIMFTLISAPITLLTKYLMERFGPNEGNI
jgi:ABC-type sugar transport system permease subunit